MITFLVTFSANLIDFSSFFSLSLNLLSCSVDVPYQTFQNWEFLINNKLRAAIKRCSDGYWLTEIQKFPTRLTLKKPASVIFVKQREVFVEF